MQTIKMSVADFENHVEKRIQSIKNILKKKGVEYSDEKDRMHNFNQGAVIENSTPEKIAWGFFLKHFISCQDIIKNGTSDMSVDVIKEKFGDMINYLIIIESMLLERKKQLSSGGMATGIQQQYVKI